jgi:uncharacterized membrane protein
MMIMYNTLLGVCAGLALIYLPRFWAAVVRERMPLQWLSTRTSDAFGWAFTFGVLGFVLTVLGGMMTLTWPLTAKPYINTPFGEPSFLLGVLLLAASWLLTRAEFRSLDEQKLRDALTPVSRIVFWLGIVLVFCTLAIIRFNVVGGAPTSEPITGLLNAQPWVENLFFALLLYGLAAVGALLFPAVVRGESRLAWQVLYWSWTVSGLGFAAFSALNFYTHTGMLVNELTDGPDLRW